MSLQRSIEIAAAAYLHSRTGLVVRLTEDSDRALEPRMVLALCPDSKGIQGLPGCESCKLVIEQRTVISLHSSRATATTDHFAHWALLKEAMMQSDLDAQLLGADPIWGINGIEDETECRQENQGGTLINSITRIIHAVSKTLS
jgi:hypothetical protein